MFVEQYQEVWHQILWFGCTEHSSFSKLLAKLQMGVHNQNEGKESQKQTGKQEMKTEGNMN